MLTDPSNEGKGTIMDPSSRLEKSPDTRGCHRTESLAAKHPTRRQVLGGLALGIGSGFAAWCDGSGRAAEPAPHPCRDDLAINESTALIFSKEAPLAPASGLRDARAVWTHLPGRPVGRVLIFLHGHNGYVTVDSAGRPRVPDWAERDDAARAAPRPSPRPRWSTAWAAWDRGSEPWSRS